MRSRDSKDGAANTEFAARERADSITVLASNIMAAPARSQSGVMLSVQGGNAGASGQNASALPWPAIAAEEDVVTAVDGERHALTEEQYAALTRRIQHAIERPALDQTLPYGTPSPAPAETIGSSGAPLFGSSGTEHLQLSFKKTMLLGVPHPPREEADSPSPFSVRATVVRDVGPPTTPPPRRSRRAGSAIGHDVAGDEPEHDAFHLDHPMVDPETIPPGLGANRREVWLEPVSPSAARGTGLILPPPPGPRDFEPPSSPVGLGFAFPLPEAFQQLEGTPPTRSASSRRPAASGAAQPGPSLAELPSTDPFAGFTAPPPGFARRWAVVLVVALAVVGVFSLAAIALRGLGAIGW